MKQRIGPEDKDLEGWIFRLSLAAASDPRTQHKHQLVRCELQFLSQRSENKDMVNPRDQSRVLWGFCCHGAQPSAVTHGPASYWRSLRQSLSFRVLWCCCLCTHLCISFIVLTLHSSYYLCVCVTHGFLSSPVSQSSTKDLRGEYWLSVWQDLGLPIRQHLRTPGGIV